LKAAAALHVLVGRLCQAQEERALHYPLLVVLHLPVLPILGRQVKRLWEVGFLTWAFLGTFLLVLEQQQLNLLESSTSNLAQVLCLKRRKPVYLQETVTSAMLKGVCLEAMLLFHHQQQENVMCQVQRSNCMAVTATLALAARCSCRQATEAAERRRALLQAAWCPSALALGTHRRAVTYPSRLVLGAPRV
jgi:hypothetical protein